MWIYLTYFVREIIFFLPDIINFNTMKSMKRQGVLFLFLFCCLFSFGQSHQSDLSWVDLSKKEEIQTVINPGTETLYNGHPTTVMLNDNKTLFCVWSYNHGGKNGFLAQSTDAGHSWAKMPVPSDWEQTRNCPSIYLLKDKNGVERLFVFSAYPNMSQTYSEDNGISWSAIKSLEKPCVMAFTSIIELKNGDYLGLYHRGYQDEDKAPLTLWKSISKDGGLTWGESIKVGEMAHHSPCEPYVFRSPDGNRLVCIARENERVDRSLMMFSDDEGETWSDFIYTPWGLTGDRHIIKYTPDGRLVAVFRDMAPNSPTKGHFVAWVGTYRDLQEGTSGQYKIKLLHSYAGSDCGYPGLEVLEDGTIIATTYIKYRPGKEKHSIVSVRFKLSDTDYILKEK